MTVLGGEDRFWLGPEGGQYAVCTSHRARHSMPITGKCLSRSTGTRGPSSHRQVAMSHFVETFSSPITQALVFPFASIGPFVCSIGRRSSA